MRSHHAIRFKLLMNKKNWRESIEIVGVVAVVASLLILAAEVWQSNQVARADAATQLISSFNAIHVQRATNPEFAELYHKMEQPDAVNSDIRIVPEPQAPQ